MADDKTEEPQLPEIPLDAEVDIPPEGTGDSLEEIKKSNDFNRFIDWMKLTFAIWIVIVSGVVIVGLSVTQFVTQRSLTDSSALSAAIDWAKGVAAIALGFAFGRALDEKKHDKHH